MSLLIIIAGAAMVTTGAIYRWWLKRGINFWATWWRAASYNLMVGGVALFTVLPDRDWYGLLVLEFSIFIFCGALFVAQKRAKRRNETAIRRNFEELSKEEVKKLDKNERKAYKGELKDFRKEVRRTNKWTKAQILIVFAAGAAVIFMYAHRGWFKITVDGDYNPTTWWPLFIVAIVVSWSILLWWIPLPVKPLVRWLISYVGFVVPALAALGFALWLAAAHFVAVANEVQWVPGEGGADSDVIATTAIDNCPTAFRLDNDNNGDGDGEIDPVPEELLSASANPDDMEAQAARAARDPEFLIQEAVEAGIWKEGDHSLATLTTEPKETDSNVKWCLSNYDAWIALAQLYPNTDWPDYVKDELDILVDKGFLTPEGRDLLVSELN